MFKQEPQASMYEQIKNVEGVVQVEMFDFQDKGCGVFVVGGSDESVSDAMSMHTYSWNVKWFIGDTEHKKEFFTAKFYRNYSAFKQAFSERML